VRGGHGLFIRPEEKEEAAIDKTLGRERDDGRGKNAITASAQKSRWKSAGVVATGTTWDTQMAMKSELRFTTPLSDRRAGGEWRWVF